MVSTLKGPIPPHPYYDKSGTSHYDEVPVPRVRPEAQTIARQANGSIALLMVEGQRVPPPFHRPKTQPQDHFRQNVLRMRKIQRETKKKESQSSQPVKALWKSSKFDEVESRIKQEIQKEPDAPRPHTERYLRAHSRTGWNPSPRSRPSSTEPPEDKLTVPKAQSARDVKFVRHDIDFIKCNGRAMRNTQIKRSPSLTALDNLKKKMEDEESKHQKGQVPNYLVKRKEDWAKQEAERIASIPDPEQPEGHRLMPESERQETLTKLRETEKELINQLQRMPVRTDTMRVRQQKEMLERKLAEIEEAVKIFSRKKVFVKQDA